MSSSLQKPVTREAFFAWAEVQNEHYEFDGVQPVTMADTNLGHSVLIGNINVQLRNRLVGKSGRSFGFGTGVATIGDAVRYPDAVVTCSPFKGRDRLVPNPIIVFEVVSPGSVRTDWIVKLREYRAVPTIRRYIIVEAEALAISVLWRDRADEMFWADGLTDDDVLILPEIGVEIPVAAIYEGIELVKRCGIR